MSHYDQILIKKTPLDDENLNELLFKPFPERTPYENGNELIITQIVGRFLGSYYDENEYFLQLHELSNSNYFHVLSEELNKVISPERLQAIQSIHSINQKENGLSANRFVAFLEGAKLIPSHKNPALHRHMRKSLISILELFEKQHNDGFSHPEFRRVLVDLMKWTWNHLAPWLEDVEFEIKMPGIVWYGEASTSQQYFLLYLVQLGCDVLYFHPEGVDSFDELDPDGELMEKRKLPTTVAIEPFPIEKPERRSTVAYRATKEMDTVLHHEGSQLFKPWQLRNYSPKSVTLKTTYDELFLIAKEKAFIRPNFKVEDGTVHIPSLFAKIMGVSENKKEYWNRLQDISEAKSTTMIRQFPFTQETRANQKFHYQHTMNREGMLDPELMMQGNWWQYKHLPNETQKAIGQAISRMCANPKLLPEGNETEEDIKLYLFSQTTKIPEEFVHLMQTFDYSQEVPKVVLYNTEMNGTLSRSDAAVLHLLNEFGIDIILYNPPGHQCIERYLDSNQFDTHWLEEMAFRQDFKEPSVFRKLFKSIKL
ncbi:YceG family protein [Alkalihalobacillus hwajinpoensis]|uniref:YceG family protein n=1 Tax=Guptibacillus hwajinpoensis TaxID=208199 RepID=UPI00188356AB|nr:YceG family protein [Pseudalkalibacillus hwajinpoensis]MBF0709330.1 YceG family protein [Pseudalkalibacillus hwajinpoensis]